MARIENDFLKLRGSIGGMTFSQDEFGTIAKKKPTVSKDRIKNNPRSEGTRKGNMEMGGGSMAAKDLRLALKLKKNGIKDQYFSGRLSGRMRKVVLLGAGLFGQRKLDIRKNGTLLEGFEFINARPLVYSVGGIKEKPSLNKKRNEVRWSSPRLNRKEQITAPEGATHISFKLGAGTVSNYGYNVSQKKYVALEQGFKNISAISESEPLPLNKKNIAPVNLEIKLTEANAIPEEVAVVTFVGVSFYRNVNGELLGIEDVGGMKVLGVC